MKNEEIEPGITTLLRAMREGDAQEKRAAGDRLFRVVQTRLHELAERYLRREGRVNPLLQPSLLVTDVFQRLVGGSNIGPADRHEFFGFARWVIPQILLDYHRKFMSREGKAPHVSLDGNVDLPDPRASLDLVAFQDILTKLAAVDPDQHDIVIDRFYLGLTLQEIAEERGKPLIWVRRKWNAARVWLHRRLSQGDSS